MPKNKRLLLILGTLLFLAAVYFLILYGLSYKQKSDETVKRAELQSQFEQLVNNPEEFYNKVKQSADDANAITKLDYTVSNSATDLLEQVAAILDNRAVSEHLREVRENKTEENQKRSDQVLNLMEKSQEGILVDLGITPNDAHTYNLISTDVTYDGSANNLDEIVRGFADEMQGVCVVNDYNCLADIQGKPPTQNIVTLYPVKISDDPLTYRIYALVRATTK